MHADDVLWDGVRGEVEETQQQVSGSEGRRNILAYIHTVISYKFFPVITVKADEFPPPFDAQRQPAGIYPRLLPVSAAGCSESCCPVIRCRQTCWELWCLAWSMLE